MLGSSIYVKKGKEKLLLFWKEHSVWQGKAKGAISSHSDKCLRRARICGVLICNLYVYLAIQRATFEREDDEASQFI